MYAISIVFLVGAVVTLVVGFLQDGLTFVFVSIGASVASAIFLAAGVFRRRPMRPATAGAPFGPEEGTAEASAAGRLARPPAREDRKPAQPAPQRRPAAERPAGKPEAPPPPPAEEPAAEPPAKKTPSKPAAKKPAAKKAPSKKPAAKKAPAKKTPSKKPAAKKTAAKKTAAKSASSRSRVVSLPERGTYHEPECRFVKGRRDTEAITLATAKKRDFTPCGVCKPGS